MARRDGYRDTRSGRGSDGEEASGAALPRQDRELYQARLSGDAGDLQGHDAAKGRAAALLSVAQEARRHRADASRRRARPASERRIWRRRHGDVCGDRRRRRLSCPRQGGPDAAPTTARRAGRDQSRRLWRSGTPHLCRIQRGEAREPGDPASGRLRFALQAERHQRRRRVRDLVEPRAGSGDERSQRRRRDRRDSDRSERQGDPPRRHRQCLRRLRRPAEFSRALQGPAGDRRRRRYGKGRQRPQIRRERRRSGRGDTRQDAGRRRYRSDRRSAEGRRGGDRRIHAFVPRSSGDRARRELSLARLSDRHRRRALRAFGARHRFHLHGAARHRSPAHLAWRADHCARSSCR